MLDHFQMGPNLVRGFAPAGIGPRDLTQFPYTGRWVTLSAARCTGAPASNSRRRFISCPRISASRSQPSRMPARSGTMSDRQPSRPPARCSRAILCDLGTGDRQSGAVRGRQRHARSLVGRRRPDLGLAVRTAPVRLFVPDHQKVLRPGAAVPVRRRDEILIRPRGCHQPESARQRPGGNRQAGSSRPQYHR